jgi:hypothetical protein
MTNEQINIAIAEACGWEQVEGEECFFDNGIEQIYIENIPDYCNDLNAMHEAEKSLNPSLAGCYGRTLTSIAWQSEQPVFAPMTATARQRAEAFLRTINKWEGGSHDH